MIQTYLLQPCLALVAAKPLLAVSIRQVRCQLIICNILLSQIDDSWETLLYARGCFFESCPFFITLLMVLVDDVYNQHINIISSEFFCIAIWVWGQWANWMQLLAWCCRCYLLDFIFLYLLSAYLRTNSDVESESDLPVTSARGAAARKVADDDLDDDFDFYG